MSDLKGKFEVVESNPKYSIILPTKGGMPYLKYAIKSVLASEFRGLELLVSLDETGDGSHEFLVQVQDPRLRVVVPPGQMSMSEHWDFAQKQALGKWQMFLGQDDLMMTGYCEAFEKLTKQAQSHNLGIVVGRRAYVCWPPLRENGLKALQYWKTDEIKVRDSEKFATQALLTDISYHAGPQMYTTTLVSKENIVSIRAANEGRLILGHPQDAYLAAALLKQSPSFLFSGRPFSWVGTSSRSAGLAVSKINSGSEASPVALEYLKSVRGSDSLSYKSRADFSHGINSRYFIDALAVVWPELLRSKKLSRKLFNLKFDAGVFARLLESGATPFMSNQFFFSTKNLIPKILVGIMLFLSSKIMRTCYRLIAFFLGTLKLKTLEFESISFVNEPDTLFRKSMLINAVP